MVGERVKRKISAILSADVAGYSRLMEADEEATVRTMESYRKTVSSLIEQHDGHVIDSPGDNILSEFGSVVDAVECAVEIQHIIKAKNVVLPESRRMEFRVGINLGDVIEEEDRIYGDGINIASRIEVLADAGGICISGRAYDHIAKKLPLGYEDIGEHTLKNITEPVHVYRIPMDSKSVTAADKAKGVADKRWRNVALALTVIIILSVGSIVVRKSMQKASPPSSEVAEQDAKSPAMKAEPSLSEKPSIAVLPFDNLSTDPEQEYFVDGMTDEIISRLSKSPWLLVIARNSTFTYRGTPVKIQQVGKELGARYIVEGSVRKSGKRVRIATQLIDAATGNDIWAETYDRELHDVFYVQDEIAQQIASNLIGESWWSEVLRAKGITADNLTAYDLALRGSYHSLKETKEDNAEARRLFKQAIKLDPSREDAYVGLGFTYATEAWYGWSTDPPGAMQRAFELAQKALEVGGASAMAHSLMNHYYSYHGKYEQALSQIERTIELNPNDGRAHMSKGWDLMQLGRLGEAVKAYERGFRLNPLPGFTEFYFASYAYKGIGRHEEAIELLTRGLTEFPERGRLYHALATNYLDLWYMQHEGSSQAPDRALEMSQRAVALVDTAADERNITVWHGGLTYAYLAKKQYDQAVAEAEKLTDMSPETGHWLMADIYTWMGKPPEMIEEMISKAGSASGFAYSAIGESEKAEEAFRQTIASKSDFTATFIAHLFLAVLYAETDRIEEAQSQATEALRLVPDYSVDVFKQRSLYMDPTVTERVANAMRKAGLPD